MKTRSRLALDRRTLLRGGMSGLGVSLALPPLEAMFDTHGVAHADGTPVPKRFGIFYWGNGMRPDKWMPTGTGAAWTPGESHQPLVPYKDYLSIATGMEVKYGGSAHHTGRAGILSGTYDRGKGTYGSPTLPSADTLVAEAWKGRTAFDYLNIGISMRGKGGNGARGTSGSASFDGSFRLRRNEYSPSALYKRIFQNVTTNPPAGQPEDPARARQMLARKSLIDLVSADARALQARLGSGDRARIEGHLEALRSLERGLNVQVGSGCSAARTAPVDPPVDLGRENLAERMKQMSDILALAWACDLTRVVMLEYMVMQADTVFWQVGATEGCHVVTHDDRGLAEKLPPQKELHGKIVKFVMGELAVLVGRLKATQEGAGNLLDSSLIVATSECSDGTGHDYDKFPLLFVGRAGGAFKSGVHYAAPDKENASKAMLTALRAVDPARFPSFGGGPGLATEPIRDLLA
jgi:hypothetical protein